MAKDSFYWFVKNYILKVLEYLKNNIIILVILLLPSVWKEQRS